jgi:hypothetical protein
MTRAQHIVYNLLEADPDEVDPQHYVDAVYQDTISGEINSISAMTANDFFHRTATTKNGKAPLRCRRNGRTKTWKRQPGVFRIPVKYGLYDYFYIDNNNADEWSTVPNPPK